VSAAPIRFYFDYISSNAYLAWCELPALASRGYVPRLFRFSERIDPEPRGAVVVKAPTTVAVTWQSPATPSTSPSPTPPASYSVSFTTDSGDGVASSATDDSAKA